MWLGTAQTCINFFSRDFGTHRNPQFLLDVLRQGEKVGQPIILFQQSNNDPAEDFTITQQGLVSDFFAAGPGLRGGGPALRRRRRSPGSRQARST